MLTLGSGTITIAAWVAACAPGSISATYPSPVVIGEAAGDIDFEINFQEKDFLGQSNFSIARGFYGGKIFVRAKKVELFFPNIAALTNMAQTAGGGNDIWTGLNVSKPVPVFVKFVHTRSDVSAKFVNVYLFKAYSKQLMFPFSREDISHQDWEFEAIADTTMTAKDIVRVEATQ